MPRCVRRVPARVQREQHDRRVRIAEERLREDFRANPERAWRRGVERLDEKCRPGPEPRKCIEEKTQAMRFLADVAQDRLRSDRFVIYRIRECATDAELGVDSNEYLGSHLS